MSNVPGNPHVPRGAEHVRLLSLAEAARRLGISRNSTLPALIACGAVSTVQVNARTRISTLEIERLCREGFSVNPVQRKVRVKKMQQAANVNAQVSNILNAKLF